MARMRSTDTASETRRALDADARDAGDVLEGNRLEPRQNVVAPRIRIEACRDGVLRAHGRNAIAGDSRAFRSPFRRREPRRDGGSTHLASVDALSWIAVGAVGRSFASERLSAIAAGWSDRCAVALPHPPRVHARL